MRGFEAKRMCRLAMLAFLALAGAGALDAKPFVPEHDGVVLERLPEKLDPSLAELKRLRRVLGQRPGDLDLATRFARRSIEAGRDRGDPRFLGQAQAALSPWWHEARPPREVLVLRATIRQSLHDFSGALADLDRVLEAAPDDAQARLTRASILTVTGRYGEALRDCDALTRVVAEIVVITCRAGPQSLTGDAAQAGRELERVSSMPVRAPAGILAWTHTLAAEIAAREDDAAAAEAHFRRALVADPRDAYLRGAYADFLIDRGRAREAAALVVRDTSNDALLLRLALAEARFTDATDEDRARLRDHRAQLAERFTAARARGDVVHRREEARFALHLQRDAPRALLLARANWEVQREPADLRILAEAANAAGDATASELVRTWQREHRYRDAALPVELRVAAGAVQ